MPKTHRYCGGFFYGEVKGLFVVFFDVIVAVCLPGFIINIELRMTIFAFTANHQDVFIEAIIRGFDSVKAETIFFTQRLITFAKIVNIIVSENRNGFIFQRIASQKIRPLLNPPCDFFLQAMRGAF